MAHNHMTRDIKPLGSCPGCDHTHAMDAGRSIGTDWIGKLEAATGGVVELAVVGGSYSYGLAHADSDIDIRGFYSAPPTNFLGIGKVEESYTIDQPDVTLHELAKFVRLALAGNPGVLEVLAADTTLVGGPVAAALRDNLPAVLSNQLRYRYAGFAHSELRRLTKLGPDDVRYPKAIRHLFRLIDQARIALTEGHIEVRVRDREALFARADLPYEQVVEEATVALAALESCRSVLPERPDRDLIEQIVIDHRIGQLGQ